MSIQITCSNEAETTQLAAQIAPLLRAGDVLLLDGPLAAGKTFFCRALVGTLGSQDAVSSPTYTISQIYTAPSAQVLHIDAYRLKDAREFHMLGLEDELEQSITLIEWGQNVEEAFEAPLQFTISMEGDARLFRTTSPRLMEALS